MKLTLNRCTPASYLNLFTPGLVWEDLLKKGGVRAMEKRSAKRANALYDIIDKSGGFYVNTVQKQFRSRMNVRVFAYLELLR